MSRVIVHYELFGDWVVLVYRWVVIVLWLMLRGVVHEWVHWIALYLRPLGSMRLYNCVLDQTWAWHLDAALSALSWRHYQRHCISTVFFVMERVRELFIILLVELGHRSLDVSLSALLHISTVNSLVVFGSPAWPSELTIPIIEVSSLFRDLTIGLDWSRIPYKLTAFLEWL